MIRCLERPLEGPLTLETLKAYLCIQGDHDDRLLQSLLSSARCALEQRLNQALGISTFEETLKKPTEGRNLSPLLSLTQETPTFTLSYTPFQELLGVLSEKDAQRKRLLEKDFTLSLEGGRGKLTLHGPFSGNLYVQYKAGYETLPPGLRQALLYYCAFFYENRGDTSTSFDEKRFRAFIKPYQDPSL